MIASPFSLEGRTAVITGAASGIGRSTAFAFGRAGAAIVAGDINSESGEQVLEDLVADGVDACFQQTDVTRQADVDGLVDLAEARYGRTDIVANIAGIMHRGKMQDVTDEELEHVLSVNFRGVLYGCRAATRVMIPRQRGAIINVSSGAIDTNGAGIGAYAISKAAVAMLTKTLAAELGPSGIRVNALAPGVIETAFSRPHFVREDGTVDPDRLTAYRQWAAGRGVIGRVGQPDDVAHAALYLVSDAASFVTGQIVRPNGGNAMPW
jgi:3-oxoacyl-[acyl-carrier protein] reductase